MDSKVGFLFYSQFTTGISEKRPFTEEDLHGGPPPMAIYVHTWDLSA